MKTNKLSFLLKALFALALSLQLNAPAVMGTAAWKDKAAKTKVKSATMTAGEAMKKVASLTYKAKNEMRNLTQKTLAEYDASVTTAIADLGAAGADASKITEAQTKIHTKLKGKEADAFKAIDKGGILSGGVTGLKALIEKSIKELTSMTSGAEATKKINAELKNANTRVDQLVKAALAGDIDGGKVKPGTFVKNPQKSLFGSSAPKTRKKITTSLLWANINQANIDKFFATYQKDGTAKFVTLEKHMTAAKAKITKDVIKKAIFGKDKKIPKATALAALEASFKDVRSMLASNLIGLYNDLIEKAEKTLKKIVKETESVKAAITKEQTKYTKTATDVANDAEKSLAKMVDQAKAEAEKAPAKVSDDADSEEAGETTEAEGAEETTEPSDTEEAADTGEAEEPADETEEAPAADDAEPVEETED